MNAFLTARRDRAVDLVVRLERERCDWIMRYIEWHTRDFLPEARVALENLRVIRWHLRRAILSAKIWLWLTKGVQLRS
jgi:hypothetical protein